MAKVIFTDEIKGYLAEQVKGRRNNELTDMINSKFGTDFSQTQIRDLKSRLGLKSGLGSMSGNNRLTTDEQEAFIRQHQQGLGSQELADLVNRKFGTSFRASQMLSYRRRHNLLSGLTGQFEKGKPSRNKGMKQEDFMTQAQIDRTKRTRFKKGSIPPNWKPIGSERVTVDGYVEIKVVDGQKQNNYKLKHRVLWEKHHGSIPKGYVVMFKDGDAQNVVIDNLSLVSKGQLAVFNKQYKRTESPILNEAILNKIKLDLTLKELKT